MTKARILADYVAGGTTAAEFDYMDGVTSNVQTQLDAKAPLAAPDLTGNVDITGNAPVLKLATNTNATNAEIQLHARSSDGNPSANKVHLKSVAPGSDEATRFACEVMSAANGTMTERLSVLNSGNVGIGTTSPSTRLHLQNSDSSSPLTIQNTNATMVMGAQNSSYFHIIQDDLTNYFSSACVAVGGFSTYSDERFKKDIEVIPQPLTAIGKMRGVSFKWIDPEKRGGNDTGKQFGCIAQDLLNVDPNLPSFQVDPLAKAGEEDIDEKHYFLDYSRITPFLIEGIKELSAKNDALEARIEALENA